MFVYVSDTAVRLSVSYKRAVGSPTPGRKHTGEKKKFKKEDHDSFR